jgi:hypothetical protein
MGTRGLLETAEALRAYKLQDVAQRITGDVLILAGEDDHFVPVEQVKQFESSLTQARSVTSVVYDRESGGAEHCQLGRRHPFGMPTSSIGCEGGMDWLSRRHQNCGKLRTSSSPRLALAPDIVRRETSNQERSVSDGSRHRPSEEYRLHFRVTFRRPG